MKRENAPPQYAGTRRAAVRRAVPEETMLAALVLCAFQGLTLEGRVLDSDGRALAGAEVHVATARPRRGVGTL